MTPNSNFAAARHCTADVFGDTHTDNVHAAWDAVGVPNDEVPQSPDPIDLSDGVTLSGQSGQQGVIQQYLLQVAVGDAATCTTTCNNGDADLYLRFGDEAEANPNSNVNECSSYSSSSNESCTTGFSSSATTLYVAVHAFNAYTDLAITCTITKCQEPNMPCSSGSDCCSGSCRKGNPQTRVCLA